MSGLNTKPTSQSVKEFLNKVEPEGKRHDCFKILTMMQKITKCKPMMWGSSIVGFGAYHYKYASGREGDWPLTGFSPHKQNISLYIMSGFEANKNLMKELGIYKTGVACLYIKKLSDVNEKKLALLIDQSVKHMRRIY